MFTCLYATCLVILLCSVTVKGDLVSHVQTLDYVVTQSIRNPSEGGGDKLCSEMLQLFIALDDIHDMLRDERDAGKRVVQKLLDDGGLAVTNIKPNFPFLMKTFNWTVDESKVLSVTIKDTIQLWKDIQIGMEIVPTTEIDYALNPDKNRK